MNRENKRKQYEKGFYKTHACMDSFTCKVCGGLMTPEGAGSSHRNHCRNCLSSLHVDEEPGDRESDCGGIMDAVAVWVRKNGEWAIIHRCRRCGKLSSNRIVADDNPMKLISIAMKPLCNSAVSLGTDRGNDSVYGWGRHVGNTVAKETACFGRPFRFLKGNGFYKSDTSTPKICLSGSVVFLYNKEKEKVGRIAGLPDR